jgi:hypothetical protein
VSPVAAVFAPVLYVNTPLLHVRSPVMGVYVVLLPVWRNGRPAEHVTGSVPPWATSADVALVGDVTPLVVAILSRPTAHPKQVCVYL